MKYRKEVKDKPYLGQGGPRDQQRRLKLQDAEGTDVGVIQDLKSEIAKLRKEITTPKEQFTGEQVDKEIRKAVKDALKETGKEDPEKIKQLEEKILKLKNISKDKDNTIQELNEGLKSHKENIASIEKKSIAKANKDLVNSDKKLKQEIKEVRENSDALIKQLAVFETTNKVQTLEIKELTNKISNKNEIIVSKDKIIENLSSKGLVGSEDLKKLIDKQNEQIEQLTAALEIDEVTLDPNRPKMQEIFIDPATNDKKLESHIDVENSSFTQKVTLDDKISKLKGLLGKFPEKV